MPKFKFKCEASKGLSGVPLEKRFWSRVLKTDECWVWQGTVDRDGYGHIKHNGKNVRSHRVAYILQIGEITDGLFVCHHCDNPACVRPDHLFLGTCSDNMKDCTRKGRNTFDVHPEFRCIPGNRQRLGEKNGRSRLTPELVKLIRQLSADGESCRGIARRLGFGGRTIDCVLKGITWKHV